MNTPSNPVPSSSEPRPFAAAVWSASQPFYWSVRRELWENRAVYIAPLAAGVVFLFGFLVNTAVLRRHIETSQLDMAHQHMFLVGRYEVAGSMIMGTALFVGVFYSLDALYGERRDRSILFWKSLPVSDLTVVLSKVTIPVVILPVLGFVITLVAQFTMLLLGSAMLLGTGMSIPALWREASFFHVPAVLAYHFITVHGLWYAPIFGWMLLVSAWAPRAPFLWAFLPPFVVCGVEKVAFNTSYCYAFLLERLSGPSDATGGSAAASSAPIDSMRHLIPVHFFDVPGLWFGLAFAAIFIAAAVRLRRYKGPV